MDLLGILEIALLLLGRRENEKCIEEYWLMARFFLELFGRFVSAFLL
jgi:hypothetical protein